MVVDGSPPPRVRAGSGSHRRATWSQSPAISCCRSPRPSSRSRGADPRPTLAHFRAREGPRGAGGDPRSLREGLLSSAHDIAEAGFAVAVAESCLAGGIGATLTSGSRTTRGASCSARALLVALSDILRAGAPRGADPAGRCSAPSAATACGSRSAARRSTPRSASCARRTARSPASSGDFSRALALPRMPWSRFATHAPPIRELPRRQ